MGLRNQQNCLWWCLTGELQTLSAVGYRQDQVVLLMFLSALWVLVNALLSFHLCGWSYMWYVCAY